jgi:inhibitor of KinA
MKHRFFSLGDNSLTVEFDTIISATSNNRVLRLADFLDANRFPGFIEIVPAYSSLTIFYDLLKVRKSFPQFASAFEAVTDIVERAVRNPAKNSRISSRSLEVPVCFDDEFAPDLDFVAAEHKLSASEVIKIFLNRTYRVFMLGFLPGFAYMGEVDERIATARKSAPRFQVPAGSVGIAGKQTGIYPLESPGGWQIIGRTPLKLFTPHDKNPTYFQTGDSVKLYEISKKEFQKFAING